MKDEELKVGDVCEIVGSPCPCEECRGLVGRDCTIVEDEKLRIREWRLAGLIVVKREQVAAFVIEIQGVKQHCPYERQYLRKRPPKRDESQWIRQQTTPRADFDKWLDGVRQGNKTPTPAEV